MGKWRVAMMAGLALAVAACGGQAKKEAQAQDADRTSMGARTEEVRSGVEGAVTSPLKDVGLIRPEKNKVLTAITYPYDMTGLAGSCATTSYEIGTLDAVLGGESYIRLKNGKKSLARRAGDEAGDAAVDAVVGVAEDATNIIPFRSLVRRASGAAKAERDAARAIEMGELRRAFLRGYGAAMGCPNVLPPGPVGEQAEAVPAATGAGAPP